MANLDPEQREVLDEGRVIHAIADMGAFTAESLVVHGGLVLEDNDGSRKYSRRLGTYATFIRNGDPVKLKTGVDDTERHVQRIAAGDNGDLFYGLMYQWNGRAGIDDDEHPSEIYRPREGDKLVFEAGAEVDGTNITPGDNVSFSADSYDEDRFHGFRVQKDNTNGFGEAVNQVTAQGEWVVVELTGSPWR